MHLQHFPFDLQRCYFKYGTWSHSEEYINVVNIRDTINTQHYTRNNMWELIATPVFRQRDDDNAKHRPQNLHIVFNMVLRRNPNKYIVIIIIPNIIFGFLCVLSFYIPSNGGDRLSLGLSILVSVSVFQILVLDMLPRASDKTPRLIIFLCTIFIMVFVSIAIDVGLMRFNNRSICFKIEKDCLSDAIFTKILTFFCNDQIVKYELLHNRGKLRRLSYQYEYENKKFSEREMEEYQSKVRKEWSTLAVISNKVCGCLYIFIFVWVLVIFFKHVVDVSKQREILIRECYERT